MKISIFLQQWHCADPGVSASPWEQLDPVPALLANA
jgi:hypothetical protein